MPRFPHVIGFKCYEDDEVTPSANTAYSAINESTGDILTGTTNAAGEGVIDLANFTNGYTDGDFIRIALDVTGTIGTDYTYKVLCKSGYAEIDEINITYD